MKKKNKSNYYFHLIIKKPKENTKQIDKKKSAVLVLCFKKKHSKYFVIEKVGSLDFKKNIFFLNFFRFIYWLQYFPGFSVKCWKVVYKYLLSNIKFLL